MNLLQMMKTRIEMLLVLVALMLQRTAVAAADCAIAAKTLTFDCSSSCASYMPCWLNTTVSTSSCKVECLAHVYNTKKTAFSLLIPFGSQKSIQELADTGPSRVVATNDEDDFATINDDYLDTINQLNFTSSTTELYVNLPVRTSVLLVLRFHLVSLSMLFTHDLTYFAFVAIMLAISSVEARGLSTSKVVSRS